MGEVDRFKLPQDRLPKLSFSGSERNHLFVQTQEGKFVDISGISGLDSKDDGRSIAVFDFDRDGYQEYLLTNANHHTLNIFHSRVGQLAPARTVLAVRLVGGNSSRSSSSQFSSRDAIGAKIVVSSSGKRTIRELRCGEGLAAQNSPTLLFGLGSEQRVDSVQVKWPSGKVQEFSDIPTMSILTVFENEADSSDGTGMQLADYLPVELKGAAVAESFPELPLDSLPDDGKWKLVTAMATWCENCRQHLPEIAQIRQQFGDELEVYAVPVDPEDTPEKLSAYVEQYAPTYELLKADEGQRKAFLEFAVGQMGDGSVPFSIIVEPGGTGCLDVQRLAFHFRPD